MGFDSYPFLDLMVVLEVSSLITAVVRITPHSSSPSQWLGGVYAFQVLSDVSDKSHCVNPIKSH